MPIKPEISQPNLQKQSDRLKQSTRLRTVLTWIAVSTATLGTIAGGMIFLDDRKYYFISLLMIVYAIIPFFVRFEKRKPQSRAVSYTHLRAHETRHDIVCRLLL